MKIHQQLAYRAFPILVRQAKAQQPMYYSNLAAELGMKSPRPLAYVLGAVGKELLHLAAKWNRPVPPIEGLVVNKATGLPGKGFGMFAPSPAAFRKSGPSEKRRIINGVLQDTFAFPAWDAVLKHFGMSPSVGVATRLPPLAKVMAAAQHGGGGESVEHKSLKEYVAQHPEVVHLPTKVGPGEVKHEFESADCIDILFKHGDEWVGVEIKPSLSSEGDLIRGLFQCVKYQALIEAQQRYRGVPLHSRVLLVLGGTLPAIILQLKHLLGVTVMEGVAKPVAKAAKVP